MKMCFKLPFVPLELREKGLMFLSYFKIEYKFHPIHFPIVSKIKAVLFHEAYTDNNFMLFVLM